MPSLKPRMIFISHAWEYDEYYWKLVEWFNEESYFYWKNCSVPRHDVCEETTKKGLKDCLTRQICPANVVIILGGMYTVHSEWIDYEMDEAIRMWKVIIGVRPWSQERMPKKLQDIADKIVGWNRLSIIQIQAVRDLT